MTGEPKDLLLIHGDARHIPLAEDSVQCIVTSPPYWGLRKYAGEQELLWLPVDHPKGSDFPEMCPHEWQTSARAGISGGQNQGDKAENADGATNRPVPPSEMQTCSRCGAWRGAYGLEPTIEMYVAHTLEILRECRRVLRPDGVLFWNIGDSYAANRGNTAENPGLDNKNKANGALAIGHNREVGNLKPKDLCLIPARVAIAAQAEVSVRNGKREAWWVRSMIIWAKPNPMPESCTDRPTDAYEHILMLTKSERYYWDADAVREPASTGWNGSSFTDERDVAKYRNLGKGPRHAEGYRPGHDARDGKERFCSGTGGYVPPGGRNLRNIWNFATQPYSGAHFATFPEELPRRCILAATSAKGCCKQCGAPWERVVRASGGTIGAAWHDHSDDLERGQRDESGGKSTDGTYKRETIGWRPTCVCPGQHGKTNPCLVLDPFGGSGTTGRVALELRRRAVLNDIAYDAEYRDLAERRTSGVNVKLPFL